MPIRSSPAITRVHTLHRVRTVVVYVQELIRIKASEIDDFAVADHLIKTHLSKPTKQHFRDQIGRRARDHLETARYLGLLYRFKHNSKFKHHTTVQGKELSAYRFQDECPKDYKEESILIDRICRMKIANASYMQTPRDYQIFRSRICLNVLAALRKAESKLSVFQIAHILGEPSLDPCTLPNKLESLLNFVTSRKFRIGDISGDERKTIHRDTNPFLDWCAQLDLIRWIDEEYVEITDRGRKMERYYGSMLPVWYCDLGNSPSVAAAALLITNFLKLTHRQDAIENLTATKTMWRMFKVDTNETLKECLGGNYDKVVRDRMLVDFTFQYDVPPEEFSEVKGTLQDLLNKLGLTTLGADDVVRFLETYNSRILLPDFKNEANQLKKEIAVEKEVKLKVIPTSIYHQFHSPYEATTYTLFKVIETPDFMVQKYQSQLQEFFAGNKRWERFAKNNPDLLLTNDFIGLIECKSTKEWDETLSLRKQVMNEISYYNEFCEALKKLGLKRRHIVLFSYEGYIRAQNVDEYEKILHENFRHIVILTHRALQRALVDVSFKNQLREMIGSARINRHVIDS